MDMTDLMLEQCRSNQLDALVCLGGGGTQKNALRLLRKGVPVITLPKTIDNDVWGTDVSFGFDTALRIPTEAVDRLHSTAHSHHRIIVVEIMGHKTGWLALGAGLAGGADVILLPEIPYNVTAVAESILARKAAGSTFSIVAVSEGAIEAGEAPGVDAMEAFAAADGSDDGTAGSALAEIEASQTDSTVRLSRALEAKTGLESRVTILGHVQRGGTPSAVDRLLATRLGTACADLIAARMTGVMVALQNDEVVPVPLEDVAGRRKSVPLDHDWITTARSLNVALGD